MSTNFIQSEYLLSNLFKNANIFQFENEVYSVLQIGKPTSSAGEPKTDLYILAKSQSSDKTREIKISYKKNNADFLENKITKERAEQIFGFDWQSIITASIQPLFSLFKERQLVFINKQGRVEAGSITLGWRFEITNKKSGLLSSFIELTDKQKIAIYTGVNASSDKKDCWVENSIIKNAGVANYILEMDLDKLTNLRDILNNLKPINASYVSDKNMYFSCKALNYRAHSDKWDGNRSLAVYVDWSINANEIVHQIVSNKPLLRKGNEQVQAIKKIQQIKNIKKSEDLVSLFYNSKKVSN